MPDNTPIKYDELGGALSRQPITDSIINRMLVEAVRFSEAHLRNKYGTFSMEHLAEYIEDSVRLYS